MFLYFYGWLVHIVGFMETNLMFLQIFTPPREPANLPLSLILLKKDHVHNTRSLCLLLSVCAVNLDSFPDKLVDYPPFPLKLYKHVSWHPFRIGLS